MGTRHRQQKTLSMPPKNALCILTSVLICEICGYILGFQPQLAAQFSSRYALRLAHFNAKLFP
jgi:hypothetical protein